MSDFLRRPVAHAERVRDDARAGLELLGQDRPQLQVRRRQQVGRHDRGARDVGLHRVLQLERHEVRRRPRPWRWRWLRRCADRVDIDAEPARAVFLGRRDRESGRRRSPDRPRNRSL